MTRPHIIGSGRYPSEPAGVIVGEIEANDLVRATRLVFQNITGTGYEEPEDLEGWLQADDRVILRIRPQRIFGVIR